MQLKLSRRDTVNWKLYSEFDFACNDLVVTQLNFFTPMFSIDLLHYPYSIATINTGYNNY